MRSLRESLIVEFYSTERSRMSNDAKFMALGAFTTGRELAKALVKTWMES